MEASMRKVRGDVAPFSGKGECRVVLREGDVEYRILPRGAGVDLADEVGSQVEVDGFVREEGEDVVSIQVRSYRVLDDFDDDESW